MSKEKCDIWFKILSYKPFLFRDVYMDVEVFVFMSVLVLVLVWVLVSCRDVNHTLFGRTPELHSPPTHFSTPF